MASPRNQKLYLCFTATVIIFFSLTTLLPHPQSAGATEVSIGEQVQLKKKMLLGSRPPACINKCLNCRPCEATLVIPPHKDTTTTTRDHDNDKIHQELFHRDDGSYYLLSWKCRCGNKIYQP